MKKIIVILVGVSILFSCNKNQIDEYAIVTFLMGEVIKNKIPVEIGDLIKVNDKIITGDDSFCDIKLGGSIIRIKSNSELDFSLLSHDGKFENTDINLKIGKILCKPKKLLKNERFLVKTPTTVAGVRGTHFTVQTDKAKTTMLKVYSGKVKIVKRISIIDKNINKAFKSSPLVLAEEKVIITAEDVKKVEKLANDMKKKGNSEEKIIEDLDKEINISKKFVSKFKIKDFESEKDEIIAIELKPVKIVKKIRRAIMKQRKNPKPNGTLLITRYEIFFIQKGEVVWQGKVINPPVEFKGKLFIATGKYIFCAAVDGPVIWKTTLANSGKIEIVDEKLQIFADEKIYKFDPDTGKRL